MKERNRNKNELNNFLKIKKKAKVKAGVMTTFFAVISGVLLILLGITGMPYYAMVIICGAYLFLCIMCFIRYKQMYEREEQVKLNIAFVEKCLSLQEYTEVKPIDIDAFKKEMLSLADAYTEILPLKNEEAEEYKNYITSLLETVKFYAHISETEKDSVKIFVKYDNEEKLRYYKPIDKVSFLDEYCIQEEDEQEEK